MNDLELRIKNLEAQLRRARLEAEFARDRESLARYSRDKLFTVFKELSVVAEPEKNYALLIGVMKHIVDFEHVALLSRNLDNVDCITTIYASHPALKSFNWQNKGELERAFKDEIIVLNDPSIALGFESDSFEFKQITRSVMLIPLILQDSQLLFVCTHHVPLSLTLVSREEVKLFQPFLAQALVSIEYRTQLEDAVTARTHELIEYQNKLKAFRSLSNEVFWSTDVNHNFIAVQDESVHRSSWVTYNMPDYSEVIGKNFQDILDKGHIKETPAFWDSFFGSIERHEIINEVEAPIDFNGKKVWVCISGEPYYDAEGQYLGYRGTVYDITKEHQQTLDLQSAKDAAEIANRSKSEYLAVMSHEIKTPLQAILGMLDLLEQTDIDDTQRSYIKHVSQSASLLQTILHDVLDLSRIESQAMVLENISFDIQFTLQSAIVQMQEKSDAKGIKLMLVPVKDNFPRMIVGDQHRLSQILFNLINNAIKFTSVGSVKIMAERFQNRLKFSVTDTGTGIPSEHLEDLFKPFIQLDGSISRKYGGTGLGLAICKRLVEHMGGKIGIKSVLGKGSTFWFEIPCKVPSTPLIGEKAIRKSVVHKERHYNILLVEDSQINQFVIKTMLEKLGHSVNLASNGVEAIDAVKQKQPDLILMDLHMPVMDGVEATKHIMTEIAPLPIVALTANSSDEERIKCRKVGMVSIASKPVTTAILKKLLEELEAVIEEANENVANGGVFIPLEDDEHPEIEVQKNVRVSTMGAVSSHGRSNAALIDALIKNKLQVAEKKDHQRTENEEH